MDVQKRYGHLDPEALLTSPDAARFLGFRPHTLEVWRHKGIGPAFVKISANCVRYRRQDLIEFAQSRIQRSTAEYENPQAYDRFGGESRVNPRSGDGQDKRQESLD